jgi:6-phosphogluconolactonase
MLVMAAVLGFSHMTWAGPQYAATVTNDESANALQVWSRTHDQLVLQGTFLTGGAGGPTGGNAEGAGNTEDGRFVFVVNPGSNDISVFDMTHGVMRVTQFGSQGTQPVSLTLHDLGHGVSLLYVVNAGGSGNIAGFTFDASSASVVFLAGSVQPLSAASASPAQIGFHPDGKVLVVTEKATNKITTYVVSSKGVAGPPNPQTSAGPTPFGFGFSPEGYLVVSEPAGALSSYRVKSNGMLQVVTASLSDHQAAACWVREVDHNINVANAARTSNNLSLYTIDHKGVLTLVQENVADTGPHPSDMAVAKDDLYVLANGTPGAVDAFALLHDGGLSLTDTDAAPSTSFGMVAH